MEADRKDTVTEISYILQQEVFFANVAFPICFPSNFKYDGHFSQTSRVILNRVLREKRFQHCLKHLLTILIQ